MTGDVVHSRGGELDTAAPAISRAELLYGWLDQYGPNTQRAYKREIVRLEEFLAGMGVALIGARRAHVVAWARSLGDVKDSTWNRALSAASSFYEYAAQEGVVEINPARHVRRKKVSADSTETVWLTQQEMRAFLTAAKDHGPRSHALFSIMLTTGCRISEVLGADVDDLVTTGGHRVLNVTRKGGKRQPLVVEGWVQAVINTYLDGRASGPLIATRARRGGHGRLDQQAAYRLVRKVAASVALPAGLGNHSMRHSMITDALRRDVPLRAVQHNAGHATAGMTERYGHIAVSLDQSPVHAVAAGLAPA